MISTLQKLDDGTIKLTILMPAGAIKKTWEEIVDESVKKANISGFRTGKAPKEMVEDKIDKEKVREEVLKKLLPQYYVEAIRENNLKPILNPKIHVENIEEGKDWQFTALTCEMPKVDLGNYKQNIQNITVKGKIVVPGKEKPFDSAQDKPEVKFDDIVGALLDGVTVNIPKILIDQEVERLLSQTLDEVKKLGLSLDQYLASTGRTPKTLRTEYEKKAENDIKFEFALQQIAEKENITVDEKEIEEAIQKAKDENERKNLETNRYLLASILRQQKTLDFLKNL